MVHEGQAFGHQGQGFIAIAVGVCADTTFGHLPKSIPLLLQAISSPADYLPIVMQTLIAVGFVGFATKWVGCLSATKCNVAWAVPVSGSASSMPVFARMW